MNQQAHNDIISIISEKTGVPIDATQRVINYYLMVMADSARRLTTAPGTATGTEEKKYPCQIMAIRRPTATLSFETFYAEPCDDADSYLETPAYDRVKITLVDVSDKSQKKHPDANIKADDWDGIIARSRKVFYGSAASHESLSGSTNHQPTQNPAAVTDIAPAYTVKYPSGQFKDITPAGVLIKYPGSANALKQLLASLKSSPDMASRNQQCIRATESALALFESGKLDRQLTIDCMTGARKAISAPVETTSADIAYSRKFAFGNLKGKSPADVLLEDASAASRLIEQKQFLGKNADKFPANRLLIEAIDQALALQAAGKLSKEVAASAQNEPTKITAEGALIYDSGLRAPRSKEKDAEGYSKVYRITISYDPASKPKYPWRISITNGKALCKHAQNGKLSIGELKKDDSTISRYLYISDDEWFTVLRKIEVSYSHFYGNMFNRRYTQACQYADAKRKEYAANH